MTRLATASKPTKLGLFAHAYIETLIKCAIGDRISPARLTLMIFTFYASHAFEPVHPLQSGALRRRRRGDRRSGLRREKPPWFYPRRVKEILLTYGLSCGSCGI